MLSTADLSAEDDPNLELVVRDMLEVSVRMPLLLPVRCRRLVVVVPDPESVLVLLLVGTGILELLGCLALIPGVGKPGVEDTELFLELGLELAFLVGVVAGLEDGHPTNTGMLDSDVDLIILLGRGVMYDLDRILAESGVLSVDELLGVLFLSCVEVFRGTLEPNPTGVGRMPRAPFLILLERRTLEPRRPPSSSELSDMLEPWRLGGREPGLDPGVRELRPPWVDWRRE